MFIQLANLYPNDFLADVVDSLNDDEFTASVDNFLLEEIDSFNDYNYGNEWEFGHKVDDRVFVDDPKLGIMGGYIFSTKHSPVNSTEKWFWIALDDGQFMDFPASEIY